MLSSIGIPQLLSTSLPGGAFAIFSFVFVSICVVLKFVLRPKHHPSIPPGPPGRLFFGHVLQFPRVQPWFKLTELGHKYGSIVRLSIFSRKYIVLNSYEDVNNLFDKRSEIYAYRPPQTMVQLCGLGGGAVLFQNGGNKLRDARKLLSAEIGQRGIVHHHGLMQDEARFMARRLLDAPGATSRSMEVTIMSWRVLYMIGFGDQTLDETLAKHATVVGKLLSDVTQYDKYLVDSFPILRYLPEWVPGCGFKKTARESKESVEYFLNVPFEDLRRKMIDGTSFPCFVSKHLGTADRNNDLVKWTAASLFGGGLTTTTSILMSFFLAMTLHPDVQVKAQEELDCVLGPGALPTFADRERLPYIECILKELLRWHPVVPLIAHSTLVDDEYKGFKIPARSIIVANSWAFMHDPSVYKDPDAFNPDRFLPPRSSGEKLDQTTNLRQFAFGYGRRTCPGMHLADSLVYITVATVLSCFTIAPELDSYKRPILPEIEYSAGAISYPPEFTCVIRKRSDATERLIRDATHAV